MATDNIWQVVLDAIEGSIVNKCAIGIKIHKYIGFPNN